MSFQLEILTPDHAVYNDEVDEVTLPGVNGEMGILAGHIPLVTTLKPGALIAKSKSGSRRFAVTTGFAEVLPTKVLVLTEAAEGADGIDIQRAKKALADAEKLLQDPKLFGEGMDQVERDTVLAEHRAAMQRARARLMVAGDE